MMEGKVRDALKLVNADTDVCGVHTMSERVRETLKDKHPVAEPAQAEVLDSTDSARVENVVLMLVVCNRQQKIHLDQEDRQR